MTNETVMGLCYVVSYLIAAFTLGIANYRTVYLRELDQHRYGVRHSDLAHGCAKSNADFVIVPIVAFWPIVLPIYLVWPSVSRKVRELTGVDTGART